MPAPLQVLPQGLLGFLQIKNGGQFPQQLVEQLVPQVDLLRWYLETNAEALPNNPGSIVPVVGNNSFGSMVPPAREFWYVSAFQCEITGLAAAENINCALGVLFAAQGQITPITEFRTFTGSATSGAFSIGSKVELFLPPQSGFYLMVQDMAGAVTATPSARITRLHT